MSVRVSKQAVGAVRRCGWRLAAGRGLGPLGLGDG